MSTDKNESNASAERNEAIRTALREQGFDTRYDEQIRGRLLAERARDLSDGELERVFANSVLGDFCIKYAQAAREHGLTMDELYAEDTASHDGVPAENRDFIEVLHYETGMSNAEATHFAAKLGDLAAKHVVLCTMSATDGLTPRQEQAHAAIESEITELVSSVPGVECAAFADDPRDATVGLHFNSRRYNSFIGGMRSYKVPLAPDAVVELWGQPFWLEHSGSGTDAHVPGGPRFVLVSINETDNAAFRDVGRGVEVARIIKETAERINAGTDLEDMALNLSDLNGNHVGAARSTRVTPAGEPEAGAVRLVIELGNSAFEIAPQAEVARIMRMAASRLEAGDHKFALHDVNGNSVGEFEMRDLPSLENDGVINMAEALATGRVYMAEEGYSGLADGEYRFIVPTAEFEPGYHQGEGDVWLVNAKGEKAPGYEEPQTVREMLLTDMSRDQKNQLRAFIDGGIDFAAHEKFYGSDDDLEP